MKFHVPCSQLVIKKKTGIAGICLEQMGVHSVLCCHSEWLNPAPLLLNFLFLTRIYVGQTK